MNKSSISSTQRSTYSQILYCVLERWTKTLNQTLHGKTDWCGSNFHQNTEILTELVVNQWNSSGIFPGFTALQLCHKVHELLLRLSVNTREIYLTDYLHVDVQRHLMGIKGQQDGMRVKCSTRFSFCRTIFSRTMVIPRTWIREKVVFYQWR